MIIIHRLFISQNIDDVACLTDTESRNGISTTPFVVHIDFRSAANVMENSIMGNSPACHKIKFNEGEGNLIGKRSQYPFCGISCRLGISRMRHRGGLINKDKEGSELRRTTVLG